MATAFFLTALAAACLTGLALRARGTHWLKAWVMSSLVVPLPIAVIGFLQPSGWFAVTLFFGTLLSVGVGGLGVLLGWLVTRKKRDDAAA